jgi:preprotein translocase subunit SecG
MKSLSERNTKDWFFDHSNKSVISGYTWTLIILVFAVLIPLAFMKSNRSELPSVKPKQEANIDLRIPVRVVKNLEQTK